MTQIIAKNIN